MGAHRAEGRRVAVRRTDENRRAADEREDFEPFETPSTPSRSLFAGLLAGHLVRDFETAARWFDLRHRHLHLEDAVLDRSGRGLDLRAFGKGVDTENLVGRFTASLS
jgi:hypothetical protein